MQVQSYVNLQAEPTCISSSQMKIILIGAMMLLLPFSIQQISASSSTGQEMTPNSWALEAEASGHMDDVIAISHSPDGRWLATAGDDDRVLVWDRQIWEVVADFDCGVCWGMWDVEFSPDSTMLAATSDKGGLWIWDAMDWERMDRSAGHEGRSVIFSPDSSELIMTTRGTQTAPSIIVMNTTDWNIVQDINLDSGSPYSLSLSPSGEELAIGHTNGSIGIWDTSVWTRTNLIEQHASQVTAINYSPNGSLAASGDFSSTLRLWNTEDWSLVASDDVSFASINDLRFTDDNSLVMAYGGNLGQWTVNPFSEEVQFLNGQQYQVLSLDMSPDSNELVVGGESGADLLRRISLNTGDNLGSPQAHAAIVRSLATSSDGSMVATADEGGRIVISNAVTLEVERTFHADGEVGAVTFSPDGGWLYALSGQGSVHVWDTENGDVVMNLSTGSTDLGPDLLDLSSDGSLLAAANLRSSFVTIWYTSNWTEAASLPGVNWPQSIQFSPDDSTLAVGEGSTSSQGGSGQVHIWSTGNWTKETTITGFEAESFVRFAPNGTTLWISSAEGDWWDQTYFTQSFSTNDWTMQVKFTNVHRLLGISPDGSQLLHSDCGGTLVNVVDGTTIDRCIGGSAFSISTFDDTGTHVFGTAFPGVLQRMGGDNDADGVSDLFDSCPETSPNVAVNDVGCIISDADSDGDGVTDAQDLCSLTRSNEPVDNSGCAARQRDGDGDGVNDLEDDCPSSIHGSTVDEYGCDVEVENPDVSNETNTSSDDNDSDGDGVIDSSDQCEGFDDSIDVDEDGVPDGCDPLIELGGDETVDEGEVIESSSEGDSLWLGFVALGFIVVSIVVLLIVRGIKRPGIEDEDYDNDLKDGNDEHTMAAKQTTSENPQLLSSPDTSLQGVWGDDDYEWLEYPPGSDEWYWRDVDSGQWVKH